MARPRYQKGCVFERGKVWVLRYREDYLKHDGTLGRRQPSVVLGAFPRKKEALRAADVFLRPLNSGAVRPQAAVTLNDFWHVYFVPEMLPTLKYSTRKMYVSLANKHLLPYFGEQRISDIQRIQVQHFVIEKQPQGYSVQTLGHLRDLMSKILETAKSWGWLQDNVARGVKLPPMERVRKARVLSVSEIAKLLDGLTEPVRTMFILALALGLRIGELLPLRLEDLDFDAGLLYVRRDYYRGHLQTPKTARSERRFKLPLLLVNTLRRYLENRKSHADLLFPNSAGTIFDDRNLIRREVEPVCDRLGIRRFGWHALRHTFSTIAENSRVPLSVVQSLLGHASASTTLLYTHAQDDAKQAALETVSRVLFPNVPNLGDCKPTKETLIQ
ncbi:MAG TPA: site-specific integrase [Terriglobia bacterium]|nr:site-specific integrase [Terriglobia bacterium]